MTRPGKKETHLFFMNIPTQRVLVVRSMSAQVRRFAHVSQVICRHATFDAFFGDVVEGEVVLEDVTVSGLRLKLETRVDSSYQEQGPERERTRLMTYIYWLGFDAQERGLPKVRE